MRRGRFDLLVLLGVVVAVGIAACGGGGGEDEDTADDGGTTAPAAATGSFAGTVEGADAYLAVVAGSQAVVAFATDGTTFSTPFGGARDGDRIDLEARDGDRLSAEIGADSITGTIVLDGEEHPVSLEPTEADAGLYRAAGEVGDEPVWVGWVVLNDGSQLGAANTAEGIVEPPAVDAGTGTITVGDMTVEVARVEPDDAPADVEGPGDEAGGVFEGGAGFAGGVAQFGGFTQFGTAGFQGSFSSFSGGGVRGGFGGFGFGARLDD